MGPLCEHVVGEQPYTLSGVMLFHHMAPDDIAATPAHRIEQSSGAERSAYSQTSSSGSLLCLIVDLAVLLMGALIDCEQDLLADVHELVQIAFLTT